MRQTMRKLDFKRANYDDVGTRFFSLQVVCFQTNYRQLTQHKKRIRFTNEHKSRCEKKAQTVGFFCWYCYLNEQNIFFCHVGHKLTFDWNRRQKHFKTKKKQHIEYGTEIMLESLSSGIKKSLKAFCIELKKKNNNHRKCRRRREKTDQFLFNQLIDSRSVFNDISMQLFSIYQWYISSWNS